ncbi:hypothetical protein AAG906_039900 [Vitis piasezkii]
MEVPIGFLAMLWSFLSFLPFFFLLLTLGLLKGSLIAPLVVGIIVFGNSAVIIGLWPAHFLWTYYCVTKTKRLGLVVKVLALISLPLPLLLWPILAIVGSLLGGLGYGFFAPLVATFEAVGETTTDKFFYCFIDGCWSTIIGSCTVVRDFTDFCFHSYFSYMDELREHVPPNEKPVDIKLSKLPSCLLVIVLGVPLDVLLITIVALWKSPYMLLKGWKRLLEDLIGREGPFLEAVCVPFAGLAIILWPIAVVVAVISAIISSLVLGFYAGVIVHQEDSLWLGLAYIVSVVSLFEEYVNDLLYLREGSCLPRPNYRRNMNPPDGDRNDRKNESEDSYNSKLLLERSKTLKFTIQQYKPMQVWDWLFKSCEENSRMLLREGLIDVNDIGECIVKGNCKKLSVKLPAWSIFQCLLASAKSNSSGLVISDEIELTKNNWPRDKVLEWFIGPLLIMKEQIKGLQLDENEEGCLKKLVMDYKNEKPEEWDDAGFPSKDNVRRAQLQAIIRRLQGIVTSLSRIPTFRRRFTGLVKMLYMEAVQSGVLANQVVNSSNSERGHGNEGPSDCGHGKDSRSSGENSEHEAHGIGDIV